MPLGSRRQCPPDDRPRSGAALQHVSSRGDQRGHGAGRWFRPGHCHHGTPGQGKCCPVAWGSSGPIWRTSKSSAGNVALFMFPLCVLFVFLMLAAQYESWVLPLAIILIVPMCLLCAIAGVWLRGHGQQHPDPNRLCGAGRPGLQERHPHCRVCARCSRKAARTASAPSSKPAASACGRSS